MFLGFVIVLTFAVVAVAAPLIAPPQHDFVYQIPRDGFSPTPQPPDKEHLLGTLSGQYDAFYGLVWGSRTAFRVGLIVTLGRAAAGVLIGLFAGYKGGWLDALLMRITDGFLAFPAVAGLVILLTLFGRFGLPMYASEYEVYDRQTDLLILALILFGWMQYARLMRGNVLGEREKEYVQAATSVGVGGWRILFRHILPNTTRGLFVLVASDIGAVVVLMAAFNFLGLTGAQMGEASLAEWGQMLRAGRNWIISMPATALKFWYVFIPPSLAILLFSVGWNLIGDGLRDLFDPYRQ